MRKLVCLLMVLGFVGSAQAILIADVEGTYYDATVNNTWPTDASAYSTLASWSYTTPTTVVQNYWYVKTGSTTTVNGDCFQGEGVKLPQLTTTVTGIDPSKTYDVYVVFHARTTGGDWYIYAAMAGEALHLYDETNADYILGTGTLISCQTKLGTISGSNSVSIDVDGPATSTNGTQRTWYDGVALVEVPEPATMLILGVGSLLMFRRK